MGGEPLQETVTVGETIVVNGVAIKILSAEHDKVRIKYWGPDDYAVDFHRRRAAGLITLTPRRVAV